MYSILKRIITFLAGFVIGGIALLVWFHSELKIENIALIVLFLPIGIWFIVASILPHKPTNEVIGDSRFFWDFLLLPIKLVAHLWWN